MSLLCTFPGRYGDLLWALPTLRAISRKLGEPVDLQICGEFASIAPLLLHQDYIGRIYVDDTWGLHPPEEWKAPPTLGDWHTGPVLHLGNRRWPEYALPFETLHTYNTHYQNVTGHIPHTELGMGEPWITPPQPDFTYSWDWIYGFSDVHFELKFGLVELLQKRPYNISGTYGRLPPLFIGSNTRWETEGGETATSWEESAQFILRSKALLACCSALHVLGAAVGTPVVCMEPLEARWNPIFYPLGTDGPQITLVKGNDGKPTHDARHTREALEKVIGR